jgi:hypothetical protein
VCTLIRISVVFVIVISILIIIQTSVLVLFFYNNLGSY